jgi:AcrR family transcriptional regulator
MTGKTSKRRRRSPRVQQKYEQARQEILDVAERLLSESGVESVTLASVAGELGMTKQAIYHYFASKEALVQSLVTMLLEREIETLIRAIENVGAGVAPLGTLIRAFYKHYVGRLNAFRFVYCQSQLYSGENFVLDEDTVRNEINPLTRHLFDALEDRLSRGSGSKKERERMRQLAFSAWVSALGLMTMLSVADATNDPLVHSDTVLLKTLSAVFDGEVSRRG